MRNLLRVIAFVACFSGFVRAESQDKMLLEMKLQEHLRSIVTPFDPAAVVHVRVRLVKVQVPLPGTGLSADDFSLAGAVITQDDIEKVQVIVITRNAIPDALRSVLNEAIDLPSSQKTFDYREMDRSLSSKMETNQVSLQMVDLAQRVERWVASNLPYAFLAYFGFALVLALGVGPLAIGLGRIAKATKEVAQRLSDGAGGTASVRPVGSESQSSAAQTSTNVGGMGAPVGEEITSLPEVAFIALMADCYWCSEDEYAAWLWKNASPVQRTQLLEKWAPGTRYAASLQNQLPKLLTHHLHPFYLKPIDLKNVSQDDVSVWVKKFPDAWSQLSPIRQLHLRLSLFEKISLQKHKGSGIALNPPAASPRERALDQRLDIADLTEAEELQLWGNPLVIAADLRKQIPSLVWVAMMEPAARQELLAPIPARDLAESWIGPAEVLNKLAEVLNEKKKTLVESYRATIQPSRQTSTFQYLVRQSTAHLKQAESSNGVEVMRHAA